jgi:hypothetical protein
MSWWIIAVLWFAGFAIVRAAVPEAAKKNAGVPYFVGTIGGWWVWYSLPQDRGIVALFVFLAIGAAAMKAVITESAMNRVGPIFGVGAIVAYVTYSNADIQADWTYALSSGWSGVLVGVAALAFIVGGVAFSNLVLKFLWRESKNRLAKR